MTRFPRLAGWAAAAAAAAVFLIPSGATASFPAPDGPQQLPAVIQRVEVPVDDPMTDTVQMTVAAAFGAAIGTAARTRRRVRRSPDVIDITETVQRLTESGPR